MHKTAGQSACTQCNQAITIMIERRFDIPFIADLALREKQIQQNYRPIIAVHKWFARRPASHMSKTLRTDEEKVLADFGKLSKKRQKKASGISRLAG